MRSVRIIQDTGVSSAAFYKTEQIQVIFYSAYGSMIVRLYNYAGDVLVEQVEVPVPGVFVDVLVTVAPLKQNFRYYVTITRSTGGSSSTTQSGATTYPDPGYSTSLDVSVAVYP